jgi:hypothetical protein
MEAKVKAKADEEGLKSEKAGKAAKAGKAKITKTVKPKPTTT